MADTLGPRQAAILRAIVREFIRSGEPVGSKHLVDRSRLDISAATARNEMARLEELGYLAQPHTSAGRVPTDTGYRFVVDALKPKQLGEGQKRAIAEELGDEPASVDELLRRAGEVVSRFTRHASAILARRARSTTLRRIEIVRVGSGSATIVVIAENGRVEQRLVHLDGDPDDAVLDGLAERVNRSLRGVSIEAAVEQMGQEVAGAAPTERAVLEGIRAALGGLSTGEDHLFVGGVANLAGEEDFERETLYRLYESLEQHTSVLELLASTMDDAPGVSVRIGSEVEMEDFQTCSIIVARFEGAGEARGSVGVIGPMRMDYERVIATANAVARMIEDTLGPPERS